MWESTARVRDSWASPEWTRPQGLGRGEEKKNPEQTGVGSQEAQGHREKMVGLNRKDQPSPWAVEFRVGAGVCQLEGPYCKSWEEEPTGHSALIS